MSGPCSGAGSRFTAISPQLKRLRNLNLGGAVQAKTLLCQVIYRYRTQTVLTPERLCSNFRMKTESRWIQTNKLHRQDNSAQHSRPFPAGSYLAPRGKGATTTTTTEWKNMFVIALIRDYSQLLSSSDGCLAPLPPLSKTPIYLACHRPTTQMSFSLCFLVIPHSYLLILNYCFIIFSALARHTSCTILYH